MSLEGSAHQSPHPLPWALLPSFGLQFLACLSPPRVSPASRGSGVCVGSLCASLQSRIQGPRGVWRGAPTGLFVGGCVTCDMTKADDSTRSAEWGSGDGCGKQDY